MAGHSQFKNIMYRKGAQDAKRAKKFAKLIKEVIVAGKSGLPEPDKNPALRLAVANCRAANMPKDNIDRALKKLQGDDDDVNYDEIRYEGYGPGGVAIIVETLTDNRNRTASDVRATFSKYGGNLGETGSVGFMFDRVGQIVYTADVADADRMFEAALEAGAENVESNGAAHEITTSIEDFGAVREALVDFLGNPEESGLVWKPRTTTPVDEDHARTLLKLVDALEDSDDVQAVSTNFEISDEVMARLTA